MGQHRPDGPAVKRLLASPGGGPHFIEETFSGVFYNTEDLQFPDRVSANIETLDHQHQRALAKATLIRSCLKKQPRGVFNVSGDLSHYDDGRRDLRLSIEEHFIEQVEAFQQIEKPYTPFSYRKSAIDAFDRQFQFFRDGIVVLSYSSNGYPDREVLERLLRNRTAIILGPMAA